MQLLTAVPPMGLELGTGIRDLGLLRALAAELRGMTDRWSERRAPDGGQAARLDALAASARGGDRPSLESLLRELAPHVLRLSHYLVGGEDAHDAAQEALTLVATKLGGFEVGRGGLRSWALAITRNHCLDRLRRRGLERRAFVVESTGPLAGATSSARDPERSSMQRHELLRVQRALAQLPESMASALMLFHVQGLAYEEISQVLGVPVGTITSWLHRGRKRLRLALQEDGG